jgi:hypothetical protein
MKNLFEAATVEEVKERMAQLRPASERGWGTTSANSGASVCRSQAQFGA